MFVTLTYRNECLPFCGSLDKTDLQKFFKRLRITLKRQGNNEGIKYFACGEYGDEKSRPHYHAIIFGLGLADSDKSLVMDCWPQCDWNARDLRGRKIKDMAFGLAEPHSIRYVAQYIDKKLSGETLKEEYHERNLENVFKIGSTGLGLRFAMDNASFYHSNLEDVLKDNIKSSIPRYYVNKLNLDREKLKQHAIDAERDCIESYTGLRLTQDEAYHVLGVDDNVALSRELAKARRQTDRNLKAHLRLYHNRDI